MAEKFSMIISTGSRKYHLICELINRNKAFETFRIYPEKDHLNFIEITGNRPMLRNKGLKKKAIKQIENYLEPKPVKKKTIEQVPPPATWRAPKRKDLHPDRPTLGERNS